MSMCISVQFISDKQLNNKMGNMKGDSAVISCLNIVLKETGPSFSTSN